MLVCKLKAAVLDKKELDHNFLAKDEEKHLPQVA